jgi:hypothetical protein
MILLLIWEYVATFKSALNKYLKIPFTNMFEIRFFVSVKYDEIWCREVVFKRGNIAKLRTVIDCF